MSKLFKLNTKITSENSGIIIHYFPPNRILFDEVSIEFLESRETVRQKLGGKFKEQNEVTSPPEVGVFYRRDVYENLNGLSNFFFLNYDNKDQLTGVEISCCKKIKVLDKSFNFEEDIRSIAIKLMRLSSNCLEDEGRFCFPDLRLEIRDDASLNGWDENDHSLAYFCCTNNLADLED